MKSEIPAISVAIDPVVLITTECTTITSSMRKHARWAHSSASAILGGGVRPISPNSRPSNLQDGFGNRKPQSRTSSVPDGGSDKGLAIRLGLRGKKEKNIQDNSLMAGFARLRRELTGCKDIHKFDTPSLFNPFLQVIHASATSAPITSLALVAISKFFSYNLISPDSPRLGQAMQLLSTAITHCRFEASDSAADEIVLLRILNLMQGMLSGPGGCLLSDESVSQMMETGLSMCCQSRVSELLRRSAEISIVKMTQSIFERLKHLEIEVYGDSETSDEKTKYYMDTLEMTSSADRNDAVKSFLTTPSSGNPCPSFEKKRDLPSDMNLIDFGSETEVNSIAEIADEFLIKPYSLQSIVESFRVLVALTDPHDRQYSDSMRVIALRIINITLEVAGPSIASHSSLAKLAEDRLCQYLFQLVRLDNMAILHESLIVVGSLLATCRSILKLQQEIFLSYLVACLHPRIEIPRELSIDPSLYAGVPQAPKLVRPSLLQISSETILPAPLKDRQKSGLEGGSRKPDSREVMVESLGALLRIPSYMVELFVNYDSEVDRGDLCEDIIGLLSRNAIPDSASWSTTNVPPLCLDALLGYIQFIFERLNDEPRFDGYPDREFLREQRKKKEIVILGTTKFNEKPNIGLEFLQSQGIIENASNPKSVAVFLRTTARISKKVLGDFLSKKGNELILEAFMDTYNFRGRRVDEALRQLLEGFRLPGESALIERIVTSFSEHYCAESPPDGIVNSDAVFVLTYAILMLNTDSYNPNLKAAARMTFEQFSNNLRGVNAGNDFDVKYLRDIYDSIKSNEIILPDEHDNKHSFDFAWKELLLKTKSAGSLILCDTNIFDADMFEATWRPIVSTLTYVFMSASDDPVFSRVITGFDQCAQIATRYGLTEAVDQVVYCLSHMTTLATDNLTNTSLNTEVRVGESSIMVSDLSIKFGRDFKAQLATVVLFRVLNGSEPILHDSWKHIVQIWINFFANSLLPPISPFNRLNITPIPLQAASQIIDRGPKASDAGFFSAFTSYISSYAADDPPEPSDEELESTLCTIDCVNSCHIDNIFSNILNIPAKDMKPLVKALLDNLPDDPSALIITVKSEAETANENRKRSVNSPTYDPALVYILELTVTIALHNNETVSTYSADVSHALYNILRNSSNYHWILVSRAMFYLLNLLHGSYEYDLIRVPIVLHIISSFKRDLFDKSAPLILHGLHLCIREPGPLRNEIMISPDFWVILRNMMGDNNSAPTVFEILEGVTLGSPPSIMADNYESAVQLLHDFASAASIVTLGQKRDSKPRRFQQLVTIEKQEKSSINAVIARGIKAISMIHSLTNRIPALIQQSHLESKEAWAAYWSPIFRALTTQCTNPCREIRHQAFTSLQHTLLSPQLTFDSQEEWSAIFGEVLLPLIVRLLKPEVYSSDPVGMSETRVQAATLLCRIFLHYLALISQHDGMLDLWLRILDIMDRLMNSGQGESLEEAVPEILKNILLVMSNCNYLVPPHKDIDERREKLWFETWKRIDRFLPNLREEFDLNLKETNGLVHAHDSSDLTENAPVRTES